MVIESIEPIGSCSETEPIEICCDDDAKYVLSEWGCLFSVLSDYGIDVTNVPGRVGKHIVDDFMELMCKAGYIEEREGEKDD